jgi:type I restriction enzyme S subunit
MNWPEYAHTMDADIQWLDRIPRSWTSRRLGSLYFEIDERRGEQDGLELLSVSIHSGVRLRSDLITDKEARAEDLSGYKVCRAGDIILNRMRAFQGGLGASPQDGIVSPDYMVIRPTGDVGSTFLGYLMKTNWFVEQMSSRLRGIGSADQGNARTPRINPTDLGNIKVPLPPPDVQGEIVGFLDQETRKVDALIAKQEQLVATLREDRTATITHAVTKGLNPNAEFVQPVDDKLASSPEHWTRRIQLKRLASVQTGLTLGKAVDSEEAVTVPYLRVANVQTGALNLDEVKTVEVTRSEVSNYLLRAGDVLMTEGGDIDKLGRGCVWSGEISPCIHQNHIFVVRCNDDLDNDFLVYLLDTSVARNYFFMTAKKTTNLASTNSTTLRRFSFSLPPRSEQNQIVKYLDQRCGKIDTLIAKGDEVIETLREYRSALITDAVTGKIDVRETVA